MIPNPLIIIIALIAILILTYIIIQKSKPTEYVPVTPWPPVIIPDSIYPPNTVPVVIIPEEKPAPVPEVPPLIKPEIKPIEPSKPRPALPPPPDIEKSNRDREERRIQEEAKRQERRDSQTKPHWMSFDEWRRRKAAGTLPK